MAFKEKWILVVWWILVVPRYWVTSGNNSTPLYHPLPLNKRHNNRKKLQMPSKLHLVYLPPTRNNWPLGAVQW